jgi:hypothetical protein
MPYAEVWGDTVDLKHLLASTVVGVVLTMGGYLIGLRIFSSQAGKLSEALIKGYSLMVGVAGCILTGVICAVLFPPKRVLVEKAQSVEVREALGAVGIEPADELEGLESLEPAARKELEELGLLEALSKVQPAGGRE